jgi:hypothetical protein
MLRQRNVSRQVRGALNEGRTDEERVALVTDVLDEAGITAPPAARILLAWVHGVLGAGFDMREFGRR